MYVSKAEIARRESEALQQKRKMSLEIQDYLSRIIEKQQPKNDVHTAKLKLKLPFIAVREDIITEQPGM